MNFMKRVLPSSIFTIALLCSATAFASSMIPLNLKQITNKAQRIFTAEVTDVRSVEENDQIVSYTTLAVLESLKGTVPADNTVVFGQAASLGGPFHDNTNLPKYKVGKTYLFFLPPQSDTTIAPIGGMQGVMEIQHGNILSLQQRKAMLKKNLTLQNAEQQAVVTSFLDSTNTDISYTSLATIIKTILANAN